MSIITLNQDLLSAQVNLVSVGLKLSVLEEGSTVVWLGGQQRYLTEETDDSCMNGKFVQLNNVCWFELYGYQYPPSCSNLRLVPPATYYLVQRMQTSGHRPYFPEKMKFKLTCCNTDSNDVIQEETFRFDMPRAQRLKPGWNRFAIGRIRIEEPCTVKLHVHAYENGSWKSGFCWDYFELMVECVPPFSLKDHCSSTILKSLSKTDGTSFETLTIPKVLKKHLANMKNHPKATVRLVNDNDNVEVRRPTRPPVYRRQQGEINVELPDADGPLGRLWRHMFGNRHGDPQ